LSLGVGGIRAKRRLELLAATSILLLNQTIMDLARKLVVPGGFPNVAEADSVHGYQTTTICTPEELFGLEAVG
jgi:hypothetical protein